MVINKFGNFIGLVQLWCVVAFFFVSYQCRGESGEKKFDKILSGYTESLKKTGHITFAFQLEEVLDGVPQDKFVGRIFYDQRNLRKCFAGTRVGDKQEAQYEDIIAPEWDRYIRVGRNEELIPTVMSCHKAENISNMNPNIYQTLGYANLLFGYFSFLGDGVYLPEILRKLGPDNVAIADGAQNQTELRFVYQEHQWRILLEAGTFSLVLFEISGKMNYLFEVLESQSFNGVIFPSKFIATTPIAPRKLTCEYSLSDVSFATLFEKDFRFSMHLPNGTNVTMKDALQVQYVWFDGKIVPKTDELMLAIARGGHKFMPGPAEPRFWFMAIGIFLILISGGRLAYKHFTCKD